MNQDPDIEQALITARPAPESLSADKAQAVFERALAASGVRERHPRRWFVRFVVGPAATAVALAGLFLRFFNPGVPPSPPTSADTPPIKAVPLETKAVPTPPTARAARAEPAAPIARYYIASTVRRTARRSVRRSPASEARLARPAIRPTVTSLPLMETAPVQPSAGVPEDTAQANGLVSEAHGSRLLVSVTSPAPLLKVAVRTAGADVPGYAQVAAVRTDAYRPPVWAQYTVSSENASLEAVLISHEVSEIPSSADNKEQGNETVR